MARISAHDVLRFTPVRSIVLSSLRKALINKQARGSRRLQLLQHLWLQDTRGR